MVAPMLRYEAPSAYPGSRLALDASTLQGGRPLIRGLRPATVATVATGLVIDSRDNEFFRTAASTSIGVRYVEGFPLDGEIEYGGAGVNLAGYVPLADRSCSLHAGSSICSSGRSRSTTSSREARSTRSSSQEGQTVFAASRFRRYSGPVKVVGNAELRAMLVGFELLEQRFRLGANTFVDGGRIFDDYSFKAPRQQGIASKFGSAGVSTSMGDEASSA